MDVSLFANWINAYATDDQRLAQFYEERFRGEFKPAFDAWLATDPKDNPSASPSPFAMSEYKLELVTLADQLESEATQLFDEGKAAIEQSTNYVLNTVFLASVLFFVGIASRFKWLPIRLSILIFAVAMLLYGVFNLVRYPVY